MNKEQILKRIKESHFHFDFTVVYGAAMVLQGAREETSDIDIVVSEELLKKFIENGYKWHYSTIDTSKKIVEFGVFEFGSGLEVKERVLIDGIYCQSLRDILDSKLKYPREKDKSDIEKLQKILNI